MFFNTFTYTTQKFHHFSNTLSTFFYTNFTFIKCLINIFQILVQHSFSNALIKKFTYSLRPKISVSSLVQIYTRASIKLRHLFWTDEILIKPVRDKWKWLCQRAYKATKGKQKVRWEGHETSKHWYVAYRSFIYTHLHSGRKAYSNLAIHANVIISAASCY